MKAEIKFIANKELDSRIYSLVETFVSEESDVTRFLLGRNEHSASLAQLFDIDGFVDDCVPRRRTGGRSPPCSYAA